MFIYTEKAPYPTNALKVIFYYTKHTNNTNIYFVKSIIIEHLKNNVYDFLLYIYIYIYIYISDFHNLHFVYVHFFIYLVYFLYFHMFDLYGGTRYQTPI